MHINGQHENIAVTIEEEYGGGKNPMLDGLWSREVSDMSTARPTNMDHDLQWESHHPEDHKQSVVCTLLHSLQTHITDKESKKVQIKKMRADLTN